MLDNDLYTSYLNLNGLYQSKDIGIYDSTNINEFIASLSIGNKWKVRVGNYFQINDGKHAHSWTVAHINRWYNVGKATKTTAHITLISRGFYSYPYDVESHKLPMNSTATTGVSQNPLNPLYATTQGVETAGYQGYYGSDMNQIYIPSIVNDLSSVLGDHLYKSSLLLSNTIDFEAKNPHNPNNSNWDGVVTANDWYDIYAILMTEVDIFGTTAFSTGIDVGANNEKLAIFNFWNPVSTQRSDSWLRSVLGHKTFCCVRAGGTAGYASTAASLSSIRPIISIQA